MSLIALPFVESGFPCLYPSIRAETPCGWAPSCGAVRENRLQPTPEGSNIPGAAAHLDPNLVNGWGLDASAMSPWWIADNGVDLATVYPATGAPLSLVVSVPGGPTGLVNNRTASSFVVSDGAGHSAKATFLFAGEDGRIRGWNPTIPAADTACDPVDADGGRRRPLRRRRDLQGARNQRQPRSALRSRLPQRPRRRVRRQL
jgi:hypothetical protein